jgi:hypothetical protein
VRQASSGRAWCSKRACLQLCYSCSDGDSMFHLIQRNLTSPGTFEGLWLQNIRQCIFIICESISSDSSRRLPRMMGCGMAKPGESTHGCIGGINRDSIIKIIPLVRHWQRWGQHPCFSCITLTHNIVGRLTLGLFAGGLQILQSELAGLSSPWCPLRRLRGHSEEIWSTRKLHATGLRKFCSSGCHRFSFLRCQ